jgi:hypothetical protein
MFIGRKNELELLNDAYNSKKSELVVLYGRRRIGKSSLIYEFAENKPVFYLFEALEGETKQGQIKHFTDQLKDQIDDSLLESMEFKKWENVFSYLTERVISKKKAGNKLILFFDELQWMAAGRSKLVSLLKYYWDNHWKKENVMLILCGSVATFMVRKVLHSKALYGRTTLEILLKGMLVDEAFLMLDKKRSKEEALRYMLVFGGVPKYLEQINLNKSFNQNMNLLCFSPHGIMMKEVERIFYNQFRESQTYRKIVMLLKDGIYSLNEIGKKLNIASGGGLRQYLCNLERAELIHSFIPYDRNANTKFKKYTLLDEYLTFYYKYIHANLRAIQETSSNKLFETLTKDSFNSWMGFAFERFCIKHSGFLSGIMGFKDEVILASPYFERNDKRFQIDLLFKRADKVITICEIKHRNKKISTKVIPEMERKCSLIKIPKGYTLEKALISLYGPDRSLKDAGYFNHFIRLDDMF